MHPKRIPIIIVFAICFWVLPLLTSCDRDTQRKVVVYVSVDQIFSEPILKDFEEETGIKVLPVYDVEAAKTTGLVNRLIAERDNPKADVFWNNEFAQTILLKEKGVLEPYSSPNADGIPHEYVDRDRCWTGFGGRARVLLVNKEKIKPADYPKSLYDLLSDRYPGHQIGISYPVFGTAATHAAVIYAALGKDQGHQFFKNLKGRGIQVVDGNSVVRDMVVSGQLTMGLTDTDDSTVAIKKGEPVEMVFLDQGMSEFGTLIIPSTVSKIKGCSHPAEAEKLIDYLLSREIEEKLRSSGCFSLSVRDNTIESLQVKGMSVNLETIYQNLEKSQKDLTEIFIR